MTHYPTYQHGKAWYVEIGDDTWSFADQHTAERFAARQGNAPTTLKNGKPLGRYTSRQHPGAKKGR